MKRQQGRWGGATWKFCRIVGRLGGFGGQSFKMTSIFPQHSPPLIYFCPLTKYKTEPVLRLPCGDSLKAVWEEECEWVQAEGGVVTSKKKKKWTMESPALRDDWNDAMHQVHAKILTVAKTREHMYIPLEWIEDIINAIAYYSILRNATAHMHRKCF